MLNGQVLISKLFQRKKKYLLAQIQFKKLETFNSIYLHSKSHFEDDGTENYLVF